MVGGIRDAVLFKEYKLLFGFAAILVTALVMNLILGAVTGTSYFNPGFAGQPIAHTDGLWNALGMYLAGFGCILLGGCPLRQLILAGEGNTDSAVTVLGLLLLPITSDWHLPVKVLQQTERSQLLLGLW